MREAKPHPSSRMLRRCRKFFGTLILMHVAACNQTSAPPEVTQTATTVAPVEAAPIITEARLIIKVHAVPVATGGDAGAVDQAFANQVSLINPPTLITSATAQLNDRTIDFASDVTRRQVVRHDGEGYLFQLELLPSERSELLHAPLTAADAVHNVRVDLDPVLAPLGLRTDRLVSADFLVNGQDHHIAIAPSEQ